MVPCKLHMHPLCVLPSRQHREPNLNHFDFLYNIPVPTWDNASMDRATIPSVPKVTLSRHIALHAQFHLHFIRTCHLYINQLKIFFLLLLLVIYILSLCSIMYHDHCYLDLPYCMFFYCLHMDSCNLCFLI